MCMVCQGEVQRRQDWRHELRVISMEMILRFTQVK